MANPKFTNRKLVVGYPGEFKVESGIRNADRGRRHKQTPAANGAGVSFERCVSGTESRLFGALRYPGNSNRQNCQVYVRLVATAYVLAGWYAYLQGVAAAATGSPADEVQTLNLHGATGGHITLGRWTFEGLSETSALIFDDGRINRGDVQAALENVRSIKKGNVTVTGAAGGPFTITFTGKLAKANIPLLTLTDSSTGGTGVTITAGTNGANNLMAISRTTSEFPALFSIIEGYDGESLTNKFKDMVLDSYSINFSRRGKANLTVVAYGDPIPEVLSGYSFPACDNLAPVQAKDSRIKIGSAYVGGDIRELTFTESNNIDVSEDAISFDDIGPDQLIAGDPTASFNALIIGSPSSALYTFADADPDNAFDALELALGVPGERLTIFAPHTQFRLDDGLQEYVGNRNVSAFRLLGRPSPDGSDIVTRGEYVGASSARFLLT
jgi:hypothetical protein